jgi:CheY-like chemotaxis protein
MSHQDKTQERQDDIKRLIVKHNRRLQKLKGQLAEKGSSIDPSIITEIEDIEVKIESLQAELEIIQQPQSDLRILVMDDEENKAEPLRMLLENYGFRVEKETNPHNVWRLVQQKNYDIIFLDIIMPHYDYDGVEVLVDIKTFSPDSKVIAITGLAQRERIAEVMRLGASDFIERSPHIPSELYQDKVRAVMEQPSLFNEVALREVLIQRLWNRVQYGQNDVRGQNLAGIIKLIFESIDGFGNLDIEIAADEEIDIQFENDHVSSFWKDRGGLIQIECKNWSTGKVGLEEYYNFQAKLTQMRLGFFISYNGFSDELRQTISDKGNKDPLIVLIDRSDLEALIKAEDRENLLKGFVRKAIRGRP